MRMLLYICVLFNYGNMILPGHSFIEESVEVMHDGAVHNVPVLLPDSYNDKPGGSASNTHAFPVVMLLHGFCITGSAQERLSLISTTGQFGSQVTPITQAGLESLVDVYKFIYVKPLAPAATRRCDLCSPQNMKKFLPDICFESGACFKRECITMFPAACFVPPENRATALANGISGLMQLVPFGGCRAWDAGSSCCRSDRPGNDLAYILKSLNEIEATYRVDNSRKYAIGIGNGAFMAMQVASSAPWAFNAIASFAGASPNDMDQYSQPPSTGKPNLLLIHATDDAFVLYDGDTTLRGEKYPGHVESIRNMVFTFDCTGSPVQSKMSLSTGYSVDLSIDTAEYTCASGESNTTSITSWSIDGGGHFLPQTASEALWDRVINWFYTTSGPSI